MAIILRGNGTAKFIRPANGVSFVLEEMQKAVGGFVEIIRCKDPRFILVAHEESKFGKHEHNYNASKLAKLFPGDYVAGDVIFCKDAEVK